MADFVITANATFKDLAVSRGRKAPERVVVVYGVPDRRAIYRVTELSVICMFVVGYISRSLTSRTASTTSSR